MVPKEFGGDGHTCDMMALDSNAMLDCSGPPFPHFTPYPTPESAGVNVFCAGPHGPPSAYAASICFSTVAVSGSLASFSRVLSPIVHVPLSCWTSILGSIGGLCFSLAPARPAG